jgi:signal transduction histidine kinase
MTRWLRVQVGERGYWAGWGGIVTTVGVMGVVIALLIGWVLSWAGRPGAGSVALLVLGSVGFAGVLVLIVLLLVRVRLATALRNAESAFLLAASHGLRTPVAGLRAAAQTLLRRDLPEADRANLLEALVHETERLARLIANLLESGRLELGIAARPLEVFDLGQLTAEAVAGLGLQAELSGAQVSCEAAPGIRVEGDPQGLRLTIDNLLQNAVTYAIEAPMLTVRAGKQGPWAVVQVIDQGMGFEPGQGPDLFTRFRGGDTGRSGTGLGLALSKAIAVAHGGDVALMSAGPGKGAVAELWLPTVEGEHA